jgi:hypothetical protein
MLSTFIPLLVEVGSVMLPSPYLQHAALRNRRCCYFIASDPHVQTALPNSGSFDSMFLLSEVEILHSVARVSPNARKLQG